MKYRYEKSETQQYIHPETGIKVLVVREVMYAREITVGGIYSPTVELVSCSYRTACHQFVKNGGAADWPEFLTIKTGELSLPIRKV